MIIWFRWFENQWTLWSIYSFFFFSFVCYSTWMFERARFSMLIFVMAIFFFLFRRWFCCILPHWQLDCGLWFQMVLKESGQPIRTVWHHSIMRKPCWFLCVWMYAFKPIPLFIRIIKFSNFYFVFSLHGHSIDGNEISEIYRFIDRSKESRSMVPHKWY